MDYFLILLYLLQVISIRKRFYIIIVLLDISFIQSVLILKNIRSVEVKICK